MIIRDLFKGEKLYAREKEEKAQREAQAEFERKKIADAEEEKRV